MSDLNKKFAQNLKRMRKTQKLTQKEFADLAGYSEKTVSKWECGLSIPPIETLFTIASILKVSIDELFKANAVYYLGIDGGGTKTTLALTDSDGRLIRQIKADTCNPVDIGFENAATVLRNGIYEVCQDIPFSSIYAFAGIAGGTAGDMHEKLHDFFSSFHFAAFENDSDNQNIIAAGLGEKDGMTLILGTGICAYVQKDRRHTRVAGWGYLIDNGGSGYNIGRDALDAYFSAMDSSGVETQLTDEINTLYTDGAEKLLGHIYDGGKKAIAAFAPAVFNAFKKGDAVATAILKRNMEYAAHILETAGKQFADNQTVPVVLAGGLTKQPLVVDLLRSSLEKPHKYNIQTLTHDPVCGAIILAKALNKESFYE